MSKVDSVGRVLFHCSRALGLSLDEQGDVPMSPGGLRYAQGTVIYIPPEVASNQLYVAPELARPGAVRDVRSTCYEAAMCLRAHVEGEDELQRRLLDVTPDRDVEPAWEAWLADPTRRVPAPPLGAYAGLRDVAELLDSWTRRDPNERRVPADGWHALAKCVLAAVPTAMAEPTPPRQALRLSPWLVRGGLLVALGVLLGVLALMLFSRQERGAPPVTVGGGVPSPAGDEAAPPLKLTVHGLDVPPYESTLRHDRIVLPRGALARGSLTLTIEGTGVPQSVGLWPPAYWTGEPTEAGPLPGPALLIMSAAGDRPVDLRAERRVVLGLDKLVVRGLELPALLLLPKPEAHASLQPRGQDASWSAYCLAIDRHVFSRPLLLARLILGERTLDLGVDVTPALLPPPTLEGDGGSGTPRGTQEKEGSGPGSAAPPINKQTDPESNPDPAPKSQKIPNEDGGSPVEPALPLSLGTDWIPVVELGIRVRMQRMGGGDAVRTEEKIGDKAQSSTLLGLDTTTGRVELRIALPERSTGQGRALELYLWPKTYWERRPELPAGFSVENVRRKMFALPMRRLAGWPHWLPMEGEQDAWRVTIQPEQVKADGAVGFLWAGEGGPVGDMTDWLSAPDKHLVSRAGAPGDEMGLKVILARVESSSGNGYYQVLLPVPAPADEGRRAANPTVSFSKVTKSQTPGGFQLVNGQRAQVSGPLYDVQSVRIRLEYDDIPKGASAPLLYPAPNTAHEDAVATTAFDSIPDLPRLREPSSARPAGPPPRRSVTLATQYNKRARVHRASIDMDLDELRKQHKAGNALLWQQQPKFGAGQEDVLVARIRVPGPPYFIDITVDPGRLNELAPEPVQARLPAVVRFELVDPRVPGGVKKEIPINDQGLAFVTPHELVGKQLQIYLRSEDRSFEVWPANTWGPTAQSSPAKEERKGDRDTVYLEPQDLTSPWTPVLKYVYEKRSVPWAGEHLTWRGMLRSEDDSDIVTWLRGSDVGSGPRLQIHVVTTQAPIGPFQLVKMPVLLARIIAPDPDRTMYELRLRR